MADQIHKPQGTFSKLMSSTFTKQEPKIDEEKTISDAKVQQDKKDLNINDDTVVPRNHETMQLRNHETMIPLDGVAIFEAVRKSVKQIGKEAATHRFTIEEKSQLADIEYTYKRQGIRTSENEITRIAINYFVEDYRANGEQSLLAKIIKRLNS
jgi:hypothetical protein